MRAAFRLLGGLLLAGALGCSSESGGAPASGGSAGAAGAGGAAGASGAGGSAVGGFAGLGFECGQAEPVADERPLPKDVTDAAPTLALRATSRRLEVWTPESSSLADPEVLTFGKSACGALLFDLESFAVPETAAEMAQRVRVVVVDPATFGTATGAPGAYGVAFAATKTTSDAIILPDDAFTNVVELDDTLAHELSHIVGGRSAPWDAWIPWWLIEGTAIMNGSYWGKQLHDQPTSFVEAWLDEADGSDATLTFDRYGLEDKTQDLAETGHDQALSGFFVEFLRVKVARPGGGYGFPDALPRLLVLMKRVSAGDDFDATFAEELDGLPLAKAQADYVQFLDDTVGDLVTRYSGTVFE